LNGPAAARIRTLHQVSLTEALDTFFSPDYATARARFQSAARAAGARLEALELAARGPRDEPLGIDIAWLGTSGAARLVLHSTGLHGVEAYAGSAIQLAALARLARPPAGCALALVHVLNPYGMAWLRRTNENNVDLNRNFLPPEETRPGPAQFDATIDRVLNPASPPGFDWFSLKAATLALRHGFRKLKQTVTEGQYDHPLGLFYGGAELQPGPRLYLEWLRDRCASARYAFALDVHTGLGRWGKQTLIMEGGIAATPRAMLAQALEGTLVDSARGDGAYLARGSMGGYLPHAFPTARIDCVLQELGTYSSLRVLRALREENRWHHHGRATLDHPVKRALREAFCPASPAWRARVVERGVRLLRAACGWTFRVNP
jgi:hypothetical protein